MTSFYAFESGSTRRIPPFLAVGALPRTLSLIVRRYARAASWSVVDILTTRTLTRATRHPHATHPDAAHPAAHSAGEPKKMTSP